MISLLKDSGWISLIVTTVITICLYLRQLKKKELSYLIYDQYPLLTKSEDLSGKFKMLFEDKHVNQVFFINIQLKNTGNVSIKSDDYERPITFTFNKEAIILSSEVTLRKPITLEPTLMVKENSFAISPILLNKNDRIGMKVIVSSYIQDSVKLDYRINEVQEIKNYEKKHSLSAIYGIMIVILLILSSFFDYVPPSWIAFKAAFKIIAVVLIFLLPILLIYSIYNEKKRYPF